MNTLPTISELRKLCQSTAPNPARESYVGRFARIFSIYVTRVLIMTPLRPNHITILSVFVFFVGIFLFFTSNIFLHILGALVIFFSIILDGCDGEVARYKKNGSIAGTLYVEPVSHDFQYGLMFPLLGYAMYLNGYSWGFIILGFIAGTAKLLYRLLDAHFWLYTQSTTKVEAATTEKIKADYYKKPLIIRFGYWINKEIFSSTGVFLLILVCAITSSLDIYLWIYALGYCVFLGLIFAKHIRALMKA